MEELKAQLESCHQQLMDSNHHKLELEGQLKDALEREQQIRAGYISPVGHVYFIVIFLRFTIFIHDVFDIELILCHYGKHKNTWLTSLPSKLQMCALHVSSRLHVHEQICFLCSFCLYYKIPLAMLERNDTLQVSGHCKLYCMFQHRHE